MGGYGSGRWKGPKKKCVEDSLIVDVRTLPGFGSCLRGRPGDVPVTDSMGRIAFSCPGWNTPLEDGGRAVAFKIACGGEIQWQCLPLAHPGSRIARVETCFLCPSDGCGDRCRKLYLPRGEKMFLCRACHDLTYRKRQQHDPRITRLKRDPDRLIELIEHSVRNRSIKNLSQLLLLRRAGEAYLQQLESELTPDEQATFERIVLEGLAKWAVGASNTYPSAR